MDEKQIAFIICANKEDYYNECMRYLQDLYVPKGYTTDIITIRDADSMTQGYNAAMQATSAKYKVYLHQDSYILNRNFIEDILSIFQGNPKIGMIGMLGGTQMPADASCYFHWNRGKVCTYSAWSGMENYLEQAFGYTEVQAADGFLLATQYDVLWREDILDGWDFYDISQSLEMQKAGYKVVIPYQREAWCYHDCGASKLKDYDVYRRKMLQEYPEIFTGEVDEGEEIERQEKIAQTNEVRKKLIKLIEQREWKVLNEYVNEIREMWLMDTQIREIVNIMEIYSMEDMSNTKQHSEWMECHSWMEMYQYYNQVRWTLMRIEYKREDERIALLWKKIQMKKISKDAIRKISAIAVEKTFRIYEALLRDETSEPLVSVLCFMNKEKEPARKTLDSICSQTYNNIEIIVLGMENGDYNTDVRIEYEKKDARIKSVIVGETGIENISENRRQKVLNGKYLALIEQGDVWRADKLEKQISFLEDHPKHVACFTWVDILDENDCIDNIKFYEKHERFCVDNREAYRWSRKLLLEGNYFCFSSACVRWNVIEEKETFSEKNLMNRDYELWLKLLEVGEVYVLQERLTYYKERTQNSEGKNIAADRYSFEEYQKTRNAYIQNLSLQKFIELFGVFVENPSALSNRELPYAKKSLISQL